MTEKHRGFIDFVCMIIFLFISSTKVVNAAEKLIVRGSDNYPPFEFINHKGNPDGFNVDIFRALMEELGYDYELKLDEWDTVTQDIQNNKIDAVIGMIYSKERAQQLRFTLPICVINRNFITRKSDNFKSIEDLKGKEIIVERGGWFHQYLKNSGLAGKIIESDDIYQSLKLLEEGKHHAVLASDLVAQFATRQMKLKNLRMRDMGIEPQNYAIAVNKTQDDLLYHFNIGLQRLKLSGTYDQIYNKWFGIYESQQNKKALIIALMIFLSIASLLVLFVWLLRRQVAKATRMLNYSKQEVGIAIDAGKISAWTYIISEHIVKSLHGESLGGTGQPIEDVYAMIHPADIDLVRKEFDSLSLGKSQMAAVSFRMHRFGDDDYRYVETKMVRVEATKEHPCRIVGTLKDVTEEVLMKQEIEDYNIKIELIIQTNEIKLIQYDVEEQVFSRVDEKGRHGHISFTIEEYLKEVHPEDVMLALQFIANLNEGKEAKLETQYRIKDEIGVYQWYIITANAYKYDTMGKIISYLGLRRNNTKWKLINSDLIVLREKAEASNRLKSAFLANMSHEIRTPLNAIVGFSELIIETEDNEEKQTFIEIVRKNNELLLQLINDVLDLSRIEAGYINFNCAVFDFSKYFNELYMSLKLREKDNVKLLCVNQYDELEIYSDCNRISQVITNFVTNAFKFTPNGSITLDYKYMNDGIKVSVTDTGIGIAPENTDRVFERFEKINDFAQGTGLGLPICKVIIEALQGSIGVKSEIGVGSTFWFWLPCRIPVGEGCHRETSMQSTINIAENAVNYPEEVKLCLDKEKKTVLIAEDIDNNYIIISAIIKSAYNVIRAENGVEAVEKARVYQPDVILMDMKMPLMDGLEATKEIRRFNPTVPIIALTAYVFDTNRDDALRAGCNEFLSKPVNRGVLMKALNICK